MEWADAWQWFVTWPLKLLAILAGGMLAQAVVRRLIKMITERIASGYYRAYADAIDNQNDDVSGDEVLAAAPGADTQMIQALQKQRRRRPSLFRNSAFASGAENLVAKVIPTEPEIQARRAQRARTVGSVLSSAANIIIGVTMVVMVLSVVGATEIVGPILASAGVVGIIIGFGAQSLVRDFISGIFILIEDQFGVGDSVDLGFGVNGTVERMDLRLTHVRSFDGTLWHVRNGEILRAGNKTQQWSRAVVDVLVPAGSDRDSARAALGRAVDAVAANPDFTSLMLETPSVRGIDKLADGHYNFTLYGKVRPGSDGDVARALREAAYQELTAAGIIGGQ
jgi:small conductance mechanosensitive channel